MLTTDGSNNVTWVPIAAGSTELADQVTIVGDGQAGMNFRWQTIQLPLRKLKPLALLTRC